MARVTHDSSRLGIQLDLGLTKVHAVAEIDSFEHLADLFHVLGWRDCSLLDHLLHLLGRLLVRLHALAIGHSAHLHREEAGSSGLNHRNGRLPMKEWC